MGYATGHLTAMIMLFSLPLQVLAEPAGGSAGHDNALPVVKLRPEIRDRERGRGYYQSLDCRALATADVRSERERRYLEERKAACLEQYRVFAPRSFPQ